MAGWVSYAVQETHGHPTARLCCGTCGEVTVVALPPRDPERLTRFIATHEECPGAVAAAS